MDCLQLQHCLKPSATNTDALAASAKLLLGEFGRAPAKDIRERKYPLPGATALREARVRLDLLGIHFQQSRWLNTLTPHYQIDSSPQLGLNVLAVIEDSITIPDPQSLSTPVHLALRANQHYSTTTCPLSPLGLGRAGLVKRSTNAPATMHTGTEEAFETKRRRFHGGCSDQGAEAGSGDISVGILPGFRGKYPTDSPDAYLFPNLLQVPGPMHLLYDALENTVRACPQYKHFLDTLRIILGFVNNKQLRQRFTALCLEDGGPEKRRFQTGATTHIDWKWEFLSAALDENLPKYKVMRRTYDAKKMKQTDSGALESSILKNLEATLKDDAYEGIALAYKMFGHIVEEFAHLCEICD